MKLTSRCDKNGDWGFVEKYKLYRWGTQGSITSVTCVTNDGKFCVPCIMRGKEFIPLSVTDEEGAKGLEAYMYARKPIYSRLKDGFVMELKVYMDFNTGEIDYEKSSFKVFTLNGMKQIKMNESELSLVQIYEIPEQISVLAKELMKEIAKVGEDRTAFLRNRF